VNKGGENETRPVGKEKIKTEKIAARASNCSVLGGGKCEGGEASRRKTVFKDVSRGGKEKLLAKAELITKTEQGKRGFNGDGGMGKVQLVDQKPLSRTQTTFVQPTVKNKATRGGTEGGKRPMNTITKEREGKENREKKGGKTWGKRFPGPRERKGPVRQKWPPRGGGGGGGGWGGGGGGGWLSNIMGQHLKIAHPAELVTRW